MSPLYATRVKILYLFADNSDGLKELYSRAQGEVSIREALRELELWGAAATFNLTAYSDSARKELTIIKDWKELVNEVRVQLSNLNAICHLSFVIVRVCVFVWCKYKGSQL